jgi:hypothetical protein
MMAGNNAVRRPSVMLCKACKAEAVVGQGNFRKETRMAYREIGDPTQKESYSRSLAVSQEVLVCIHCNHVQEELGFIRS